ncbi:MAG: hypothetical protein LBU64_07660, partial [Planctomycetota bacterium]|nr:hypothetical protein [Planctomycetota bacterium]
FSKWITNVYSNIRQYVGREMNRETRGVFDRWLASEREIAEAEAYYGGLESADFLNLVDDEEKRKKLEEKLARNRQRIMNRHAGEMAKAWTKANADRGKLAAEAKSEVESEPVYKALKAAREAGGLDRDAAIKTVGAETVAKIIAAHGDIFARKPKPVELAAVLRKAGYHEKDPVALFLKELSEAASVEEAVKNRGSQGRKTRYYEALEVIAKAGGIDPDILPEIGQEVMDGLEKHSGLFRPDGRENMDRAAVGNGFKNPSDMLAAMAKTPAAETVIDRLTERKVRAKAKAARAWAEESLAEVMDDTPPAGQEALHDPDEDPMAESIEMKRDALRQAIEAKTRRRESYLGRRKLEDNARKELRSKKTLREAMDYNNHAKTERFWSGAAAAAIAKGNREAALEALDKQQKYHALATEAFRIRREYDDFMRRNGQRVAQSEMKSVEEAYRNTIRDILVWSGVVMDRSGHFAPANSDPNRLILPDRIMDEHDVSKDGTPEASVEHFFPSLKTLIPQWIQEKRLPKGYMGSILDLTPDMMTDIDISIKNLLKYGRGELTALRDKDNRIIADLRDNLLATMGTLPNKHRLRADKKTRDRVRAAWDDYLAGNLSIDVLAEEMDGLPLHQGKEMGLAMRLIKKIRDGEVMQMETISTFTENTKEDFRILDAFVQRLRKENGGDFFNPEGVPSPSDLTNGRSADTEWDPDMILSVMFNAGNRGNLYALQKGFGLTDDELNRLFSLATEKEWLAVQHAAKQMGGLFNELDAVHFRLTNRHLERIEPERRTVRTADGKALELDGWYYPLVYDPKLNDTAAKNAEAADYRIVMSAIFNPQKLQDGFTKSRQTDEEGNPVVTYPPLLKTRVIFDHMEAVTRWINLAEPLMEFRRVTMDPAFREMFIRKFGEERYRDLRKWTNRMARPDKGIDEGMNRALRYLRNASTVTALGLNIKSAGRQVSSVGVAADAMSQASRTKTSGWLWLAKGLRKMGFLGSISRLLSPLGFKSEATEEMFRLSPEARYRAENVNKEIRESINRFRPGSSRVARMWRKVRGPLLHLTISVDHLVSGAAWWGAYEQASTGNAGFDIEGMSPEEIQEKAVDYANYIVRTQQSPYQADYTRIQADPGAVSLMTQFMGGLTPYLNNSYINVQLARQLGWKRAKPMSRHIINAYVIPTIGITMLGQEIWKHLTGDDEEDEDEHPRAWALAEELSGQALGGLPGIRGAARFGLRRLRTGRMDWFSLVPPTFALPARVGDRLISAGEELIEEDGDAYAAGKDLGMAFAEILGVSAPIRQLEPLAEEWGLVEEE